ANLGEAEADWLTGLVARGARRRLLAATDDADAARAVARERLRGVVALGSLSRVGVPATRVTHECREFEAFAAREAAADRTAGAAGRRGPSGAHRLMRPAFLIVP